MFITLVRTYTYRYNTSGGRGHATHQKRTIIIYSASHTYIPIQLPFSLHSLTITHIHTWAQILFAGWLFFCSSFLHLLLRFACLFFISSCKKTYNFILCLVLHFIMMTRYSYNVQNFMTQKIARFDGWYDHAFSVTYQRMFHDDGIDGKTSIQLRHYAELAGWGEKSKRNFVNSNGRLCHTQRIQFEKCSVSFIF